MQTDADKRGYHFSEVSRKRGLVLMRELSVYFCSKCGRYGYYQLVRNAVCPNCDKKMTRLDMRYQDFMHLSLKERDELIIQEIITSDASITNRMITAARASDTRQVIAALNTRIHELETENEKLNETVTWMHQTIWDLLRKNKTLEHQLEDPILEKQPD